MVLLIRIKILIKGLVVVKNFKRVVSGCLVSIFILSAGTLPAYAYNPYAGNYHDTVCTVKAIR